MLSVRPRHKARALASAVAGCALVPMLALAPTAQAGGGTENGYTEVVSVRWQQRHDGTGPLQGNVANVFVDGTYSEIEGYRSAVSGYASVEDFTCPAGVLPPANYVMERPPTPCTFHAAYFFKIEGMRLAVDDSLNSASLEGVARAYGGFDAAYDEVTLAPLPIHLTLTGTGTVTHTTASHQIEVDGEPKTMVVVADERDASVSGSFGRYAVGGAATLSPEASLFAQTNTVVD